MAHDDCKTNSTVSMDIELDIGKPEIAKCLRITQMTEAELKQNPVKFNPFIVCFWLIFVRIFILFFIVLYIVFTYF